MRMARGGILDRKSVGIDRKSERLYGSGKMRRSAFKVLALMAALIVIAGLLTNSLSHLSCTVLNGAATLTIKLGDLGPGTVRAFCYRDPAGRKLRFLLARDSSGRVHTVFDACGQCYKFHKGYS